MAWLGGMPALSVAWPFSGLPVVVAATQVFCDPVLWCSTSLNLLLWDIASTRVVCPDAWTLCALPWGTCGLAAWCMIISGVMRASGLQG